MEVKESEIKGVFKVDGRFATRNLVKGMNVYGEKVVKVDGKEYRIWDHWRSKPAAALKKGLKQLKVWPGMKMLYLGIASGTTASHFSDIAGKRGIIYGVEMSDRVLRELIPHAEKRKNIVPILGDARKVEEYSHLIPEEVEVVYEDIADPDQIKILKMNCEAFLKSGGYAMIAIKSQSIDVTKPPRQVYKQCISELSKDFEIIEKVELDPFEKHHLFLVLRSKH